MMTPHLFKSALILEDEPNLASALKIAMARIHLPTVLTSTLSEARREIARINPDFVLLDRKVPDGDSLSLCAELRNTGYEGMILMLTAAGETKDRIAGLRSGADDYLAKPFSWEALSARIEALGRRARKGTDSAGDLWTIDKNRLRIQSPKGWVQLTPLEFKLATHLIQASGAIVSRDDLLRSVWGFTLLPKTRTVDLFVGRIRKLFEPNPEEPRHFLTIRGAGYRFQN